MISDAEPPAMEDAVWVPPYEVIAVQPTDQTLDGPHVDSAQAKPAIVEEVQTCPSIAETPTSARAGEDV